jgi:hypothetical protein
VVIRSTGKLPQQNIWIKSFAAEEIKLDAPKMTWSQGRLPKCPYPKCPYPKGPYPKMQSSSAKTDETIRSSISDAVFRETFGS